MSSRRTGPIPALVGTALIIGLTYLALTEGVARLSRTEAPVTAQGTGYLPQLVYDPPETVPTTAEHGPVGPVSLVFADDPAPAGGQRWIAVSASTGDYRALSAPALPESGPGRIAVSPDGALLAWAADGGIIAYDTNDDTARRLGDGLGTVTQVGRFSPDGRHLTAYDGSLHVVEAATGAVVADVADVDDRQARQAVWTPDGRALTYVSNGAVVTHDWARDRTTSSRAPIAPGATLAWHPEAELLAASRRTRFGQQVDVFRVTDAGELVPLRPVRAEGHSMLALLGFVDVDSLMLLGRSLETGPLPKAYRVAVDGTTGPTDVMRLPVDAHVASTLQVAAAPMATGSHAFAEPDWPVSDAAKLVGSVLIGLFALGVYLTRRPA